MEEPLSVQLKLKELKWKDLKDLYQPKWAKRAKMEDLFQPNLAKSAIMEDLYQLNLNGMSKNEKSLSVKMKLKRVKMEDLSYVS